jgi:AraC family transcriptional regulator
MLMLETAKYLGINTSSIYGGGIYISLTHYKEENLPIGPQPQHAHVNPHLTLLLQGGTEEKWNNGVFERFAGDIVFYPTAKPHQNLQTRAGSKNLNFEFEPSFFKENEISESAMEMAADKTPATKFLLLKVYKEMMFADPSSVESSRMLLLSLLEGPDRFYQKGSAAHPAWIIKVREYIHDRWNEPVTLQELSFVAGVHPITISKHFPRYFSCTLGEYHRRLKIEKAFGLIKSSDLSLIEIAFECGFADQSHFIRVFRMMTGFIPNDFRRL